MLFIKYDNESGNRWTETKYVPNLQVDSKYLDNVHHIIVDGDESDYIKQKFGYFNRASGGWIMTIPWATPSHNGTQKWYGDIAKTILANL